MRVIRLKCVPGTNEYCKAHPEICDAVVIAKRQSDGKGTKGRSFSSENGGVYLTIVRSHENLLAKDAFRLMISASVAVSKTIESYGVRPVIRWPNDVLVDGKKISGTLIENTFRGDFIVRSMIGIGVNVKNKLPDELKDTAISLSEICGKSVRPKSFTKKLIKNLVSDFSVFDYLSYIDWLGKNVEVTTEKESFTAVAEAIGDDGRLIVSRGGKKVALSFAEVTLRL